MYNIEGDNVKFYAKEGRNVKYWEYKYNLQNRLEKVTLNGKKVAEFLYDSDGNRVKTVEYKVNPNKVEDIPEKINTTNFIYNYSKKVIMEEKTKEKETNNEITYTSYIFAFGKHFASIKGIAGESKDITYFHYDNTGSTRVMTDKNGEKVFDQDYLPFGQNLAKSNQLKVYNEVGME